MKKINHIVNLVLAFTMAFSVSIPLAAATSYAEPDISYYSTWVQLSQTYNNFDIKSGTATMTATTSGAIDCTKVTVEMYLEKRVNGEWVEVFSWDASKSSDYVALEKTRAVTKGYNYRLRSVHTATGPRGTDTDEIISDYIWY